MEIRDYYGGGRNYKEAVLGDLSAVGRNAKEAKEGLTRIISRAASGSYEPAVVRSGGMAAVVFRSPTGWAYQLFGDHRPLPASGVATVAAMTMLDTDSRDEAIQAAAFDVASLDGIDYRSDADLPAWLTCPRRRASVLDLCRFRRESSREAA